MKRLTRCDQFLAMANLKLRDNQDVYILGVKKYRQSGFLPMTAVENTTSQLRIVGSTLT